MKNDLFPCFDYLTQTQLGTFFGETSHVVGRWLKEIGLRDAFGQPTRQAFKDGLAKQVVAEPLRFIAWHKERIVGMLVHAGHPLKDAASDQQPALTLKGPFTVRCSSPEGDGYEVVDSNGIVGVWVRGEVNARWIELLMNYAYDHGKWQ